MRTATRAGARPMKTAMRVVGRALLVLAIGSLAAWAALALYLGPPQSAFGALAVAAVGLVAAVSAVLPRLRLVEIHADLTYLKYFLIKCMRAFREVLIR